MPTIANIIITLQIEGAPNDAGYVVDQLLDAGFFQDAINAHDCDAGPLRVLTAHAGAAPEVNQLVHAARRALPLLCKLGDFIGNGPIDPTNPRSLGERCDTIGALRAALSALGVPEAEMAPTCLEPTP